MRFILSSLLISLTLTLSSQALMLADQGGLYVDLEKKLNKLDGRLVNSKEGVKNAITMIAVWRLDSSKFSEPLIPGFYTYHTACIHCHSFIFFQNKDGTREYLMENNFSKFIEFGAKHSVKLNEKEACEQLAQLIALWESGSLKN